jgi:hypothetical protein
LRKAGGEARRTDCPHRSHGRESRFGGDTDADDGTFRIAGRLFRWRDVVEVRLAGEPPNKLREAPHDLV